jgi:rhamnulokinase
MTAVVAVDFGAASIRVCRVELPSGEPVVVHRYAHQPRPDGRWDWSRLVSEMMRGISMALPAASIGIDTWGVDYGLLDAHGGLVAAPYSYRHARTDGYRAIVDKLGEAELYATTGVQVQSFNTLFQLAVHDRVELARARHAVMLPELLAHHLTGEVRAERSSAGTTGLVDLTTGDWSRELLEAIDVDPGLLPPISPAGSYVGTWQGVPVHLVGGHDTASAFAAVSAQAPTNAALVSAGTWVLVGREQAEPEVAEWARRANFTNEIGALGGYRFLKNLAGGWLIEGCRAAWGDPPIVDLLTAATAVDHDGRIVDATDPRFLHPADMLTEVTAAADLPRDAAPPVVVRTIVESLVAATAGVLDQLRGIGEVHVFGGGGQSALYRRRLAEETGLPVVVGPVEATALGNALVQGMALGLQPEPGLEPEAGRAAAG